MGVHSQSGGPGDYVDEDLNLSDLVSASTARTNLGFADPILDKAEPGEIGATTAAAGTFTTLTVNTTANLPADSIDAITEIAAALKSGADTTLVTGTAGTDGNVATWNADGDLVDGGQTPGGSGGTSIESADTFTSAKTEEVVGSVTVNAEDNAGTGTVRVAEFAADASDRPQALLEDGVLAAPSLSFASDKDSGFFLSGISVIDLVIGGAQIFQWDSSSVISKKPLNLSNNSLQNAKSVSIPGSSGNFEGESGTVDIQVIGADPTAQTSRAHIYAKDDGGVASIYVQDEDGTVEKVTGLAVSNWTESSFAGGRGGSVWAANGTSKDAVIQPAGVGALSRGITDSTSDNDGGNARGQHAVDWSGVRGASDEVASGDAAVICGGNRIKASGSRSSVLGGLDITTTGNHTAVAGTENTVNGAQAVGFGARNSASGNSSSVPGGDSASADKEGQFAYASGKFSTAGDAQFSRLIARNQTTDATDTELFLDGSSARATIASGTTWTFQGRISAVQTGGSSGTAGDSAGFKFEGVIKNVGGTTSLVSAVAVTEIDSDAAVTWSGSVTADDTNDALKIEVTGEANKNVNWVATIELTEVA